jgi:peptidoglycan/LPS O-acetylase OafA/YrhL
MQHAFRMASRLEIRSLTGLRGLACLLVVIAHYAGWTRVTPADVPLPTWFRYLSVTGIGMSIFFTLSGFVIAMSYSHWEWRTQPVLSLTRLFFYRLARLYPAFLLFALVVIVRSPALHELSDPAVQAYLVPHLLLMQDWLPTKFDGQMAPDDRFHVSWSLSVECGLYLLFGLGAVLAAGARRPWALAVLFFLATPLLLYAAWAGRSSLAPSGWSDGDWWRWLLFFSPYGVSLQFGIGVAAYGLFKAKPPGMRMSSDAGALLLIAVYLATVGGAVPFDALGISSLYLGASLATAAIMVGSASDSLTCRLLSGRGIVYIGTISYSLYLFHFVVPDLTAHISRQAFDSATFVHHGANFALTLALAIILSTGVYRLVEVPGRHLVRSVADRALGARPVSSGTAPAQ